MRVWQNKHLIIHLFKKGLADNFGGSLLGLGWILIKPLAFLVLYGFVFSMVLRIGSGQKYEEIPFALWLLCGLVPWTFFAEALLSASVSITSNAQLVTKSMFDKEVLPLSAALGAVVSHIITLALLMIACFIFGIIPKVGILGLLVIIPSFIMYIVGWSMILSAINVYFRDMAQILPVALQFLFFLTPIVFPIELVPEWAQSIFLINPHHYFIECYRETILLGKLPSIQILVLISLLSLIFMIASQIFFRKLSSDFADML